MRQKMNIIEDFLKIKEYLGLSEEWSLELQFTWNEGFCNREQKRVMIGIKGGYNRKLLVHECLHATDMTHHKQPTYQGYLKADEY